MFDISNFLSDEFLTNTFYQKKIAYVFIFGTLPTRPNRTCYTYAESNFKTFNMDVLNFHFKNSAEVDVTFENGEITEIKNLDAGESVNLVSHLTNSPGNKKRNFYYFNGENLFVGEYEKNNNGWQFKPGVRTCLKSFENKGK